MHQSRATTEYLRIDEAQTRLGGSNHSTGPNRPVIPLLHALMCFSAFFFFFPLSLSLYYGALLLYPVYTGILYVGDLIKHGIPND